jgi:DNA-binding transcriptional ArsR family regulator
MVTIVSHTAAERTTPPAILAAEEPGKRHAPRASSCPPDLFWRQNRPENGTLRAPVGERKVDGAAPAMPTYNQMVVDKDTDLDGVFHAMADATRRDIVRTLVQSEQSVSALARRYPISLTAVQKHVAVLERVGLVTKERRGRECIVRPRMERMRAARAAFDSLEQLWMDRVAAMDAILAEGLSARSSEPCDQEKEYPHARRQR